MLPFGSILSNIPLVVFAAIYLLYFGATVINKAVPENKPTAVSEKFRSIKNNSGSDFARNIDYYEVITEKSKVSNHEKAKCIIKDVFIHFSDISEPENYSLSEIIIFSYSGDYNLFSRPPPVLG